MNTVFTYPYARNFYLRHPFKLIKHFCANIKYAWQRATKGYCTQDTWDIDVWFLKTMPSMLYELAEKGNSYPEQLGFSSRAQWARKLRDIANDLYKCTEEAADQLNEFSEAYFTDVYNRELAKKYLDRRIEIYKEQEVIREEAFQELAKYLPYLWD